MNRIIKLALLLGLAVCSATSASAASQVFKIASLAPQGSDWMNFIQEGAAQITEETDGRVKFKFFAGGIQGSDSKVCLLYTSPSPRDGLLSRMPSSA